MVGRARIAAWAALLLGIASVLMSFGLLELMGFIVYSVTSRSLGPYQPSWREILYHLPKIFPVASLIGGGVLGAAVGGLGFWLARRGRGSAGGGRVAASAARFSACGLAGGVLYLLILMAVLVYRWMMWG